MARMPNGTADTAAAGEANALAAQPGLGALPASLLEKLHEFGRAAAKGGLAPKTISAMKSDGRIFSAWCTARNEGWLPAAAKTVASFVEAMAAAGKAPATIARYLASIALWHRAADLPSPTGAMPVTMARRAHLRAVGRRQKQAKPIGDAEIAEMQAAMVESEGAGQGDSPVATARDRALLLVARDTLCRASELVWLRWDDLVGQRHRLSVAARNHKRPDAQSRPVSGAD